MDYLPRRKQCNYTWAIAPAYSAELGSYTDQKSRLLLVLEFYEGPQDFVPNLHPQN